MEAADQAQCPLGNTLYAFPRYGQHNRASEVFLSLEGWTVDPLRPTQDIREQLNLFGPKEIAEGVTVYNAKPQTYGMTPHFSKTLQDDMAILLMSALPSPAREAVAAFAGGIRPSGATIRIAVELAETVVGKAVAYEVAQEETDGTLTFEAKTAKGHLITGELSLTGEFGIDVYQDETESSEVGVGDINVGDIWLEHLPQASVRDLTQRL